MFKLQDSVKIIMLILFDIAILITNSKIYLILSTFILLYLIFIKFKNVKFIIYYIKIFIIWLLFIILLYIILIGKYLILLFAYKLLLILIANLIFINISNFEELNKGINKVLSPLNKLNINFYDFSYNISLSIYFINKLFQLSNEMRKSCKESAKKSDKIFLNLILANRKMEEYEEILKLKFYNKKVQDKWETKEKAILVIVSIVFIIVLVGK